MPDKECLNLRIAEMESKIDTHHTTLESHDRRLSDLTTALHENTALTKQIADNTKEMVDLFKEAKVFIKWSGVARRIIIWAASFSAAVLYFWDSILLWVKK